MTKIQKSWYTCGLPLLCSNVGEIYHPPSINAITNQFQWSIVNCKYWPYKHSLIYQSHINKTTKSFPPRHKPSPRSYKPGLCWYNQRLDKSWHANPVNTSRILYRNDSRNDPFDLRIHVSVQIRWRTKLNLQKHSQHFFVTKSTAVSFKRNQSPAWLFVSETFLHPFTIPVLVISNTMLLQMRESTPGHDSSAYMRVKRQRRLCVLWIAIWLLRCIHILTCIYIIIYIYSTHCLILAAHFHTPHPKGCTQFFSLGTACNWGMFRLFLHRLWCFPPCNSPGWFLFYAAALESFPCINLSLRNSQLPVSRKNDWDSNWNEKNYGWSGAIIIWSWLNITRYSRFSLVLFRVLVSDEGKDCHPTMACSAHFRCRKKLGAFQPPEIQDGKPPSIPPKNKKSIFKE